MGVFQRIKNVFKPNGNQEKRSGFSWKDAIMWGGGPTKSGVTVTPQTAIGLSALWRATDIVASLIGVFPKKLFEKDVKNGTRQEVWNNPTSALLSKLPMNDETPFVFWYTMVARAMLFGGSAAVIIRDGNGQVTKLELVDGVVTPFKATDGKRYIYAGNYSRAIPYSDCIYIPGLMILDGKCGKGIIQTFADTFGEIKAAEMFSQMYYANGGRLAGYVSYKELLTMPQLDSRKSSWTQNYGTIDGMNGTAILDGDARYHTLNTSMKDSESTISRTFGIAEISRMTGVPLPMLGETAKTSYNNIEGMNRHFYDLTILPWVTKITQELEKKLLPVITPLYIRFNTAALLDADKLKQAQILNILLNNGTLNINEVRALIDRNPVEGGDKHRVQMQDVSITDTLTEDEAKNKDDVKDETEDSDE